MIRDAQHAVWPGSGDRPRLWTLVRLWALASVLAITGNARADSELEPDETLLFFPTAAYREPDTGRWAIPLHGWVFERERDSLWRRALLASLAGQLDVEGDPERERRLARRLHYFLVDNERGKQVTVEIRGINAVLGPSAANGHLHGQLKLDATRIAGADGRWVHFRALNVPARAGTVWGRVQFVEPSGVSVISDIDDTIKHSGVGDTGELLRTTFVETTEPIAGMADQYMRWARRGAVFHYVSGSPWQLFPLLDRFLAEFGFPDGSFHLKSVRLKDRSVFNLVAEPHETKNESIEKLLQRYPGRRFVMVGDAGQRDPEIYADFARRYPQQVGGIFIRRIDPGDRDRQRWRETFADIDPSRWIVSSDPADLARFDPLFEGEVPR